METNRRLLRAWAVATLGIVALEIFASGPGSRLGLPFLLQIGIMRAAEACWILTSLFLAGLGRREIYLPEGSLARGLRRGFLWSAGFGALALIVFAVLWGQGRDPLRWLGLSHGAFGSDPVLHLAVACGVGPVVEELYFRGLLYRVLRVRGRVPAVGGTTLLFGFLHAGAGGLPWVPFVGGALFAVALEIEKNLLVPITIHVLGNTALFALARFAPKFQL